MRILIGTTEVCGQLHNYQLALERAGCNVLSVISHRDPYFQNLEYDIETHNFIYDYTKRKWRFSIIARTMRKISHLLGKKFIQGLYKRFILRKISWSDSIIYFWGERTFFSDFSDLEFAVKKRKKIIFFLWGSDVRQKEAFFSEFYKRDLVPDKQDLFRKIQVMRRVEKYASLIYSVPDQAGLALRKYKHLQLCFDIGKYKFCLPTNDIPLVIHAPSKPEMKGTDHILECIEQLREAGLKFNFQLVQNLQNSELINLLSRADILVDELIFHGPGILSFEAMASGCVSLTKVWSGNSIDFRPPVVPVDHRTLFDNLKTLVDDKRLRVEIAIKARKYVEQNNTLEFLGAKLVREMNGSQDSVYDYQPTFFTDVVQKLI